MKRPESGLPGSLDVRIEAYLDGELDADQASRLEAELAADPARLDDLELARTVKETLRGLPATPAPDSIVATVLSTARREARRDLAVRLRRLLQPALRLDWRPVVAMATLVVLVFGAVLVDRSGRPDALDDPAVAEALEQVRWTLAVVADVGRRTGRTVRDDVLEPHVVVPVQNALEHVFEPSQPTE